jgi:hypothetical protein
MGGGGRSGPIGSLQIGDSRGLGRGLEEFVHTFDNLGVNLKDILVSFDVISLFTRVLLKDAPDLLY